MGMFLGGFIGWDSPKINASLSLKPINYKYVTKFNGNPPNYIQMFSWYMHAVLHLSGLFHFELSFQLHFLLAMKCFKCYTQITLSRPFLYITLTPG